MDKNIKTNKFSIIVCTYNPDDRVLGRCLEAIAGMDTEDVSTEIILVDNNSIRPVSQRDYVKRFLECHRDISIIEEKRQGLVYARIAGINISTSDFLVFLDDDNEVDKNYLRELNKLVSNYPHVGAWGPGSVTVDFIDGLNGFIESDIAGMFQKRETKAIEYSMVRSWQPCYPFGTGLSIKKEIALFYAAKILSGDYTLTGRSGGRMTSGEDSQMILSAIVNGYAAGNSPALKVNHMINGDKVQFEYLKRLTFGAASCYYQFHLEVLPEFIERVDGSAVLFNNKIYYKKACKFYRLKVRGKKMKILKMIEELGSIHSLICAKKKPIPKSLSRLLDKIGC